jgi:hypothetical protein
MSKVVRYFTASVMCIISAGAFAERPHVVRVLPGYTCKVLNITEAQAMDPTFHTPYYSQPSASSPISGYAALEVAVRTPVHNVNGFDEAMFPNGGTVWIQANLLKDYRSVSDPTAKCLPVLMSNGRQGFDFPH